MPKLFSTESIASLLKRSSRRGARAKQAGHPRRLSIETLEERTVLSANVYISEFLASNDLGLEDGDGDSSDWIELYNAGSTTADLSGYYLTDDSAELTKWAFPSGTSLAAGATLIVFASDKGALGPVGELHTTYKLSAGGEYLGLVDPDGLTVVHDYSPEYPSQETDISYGLSMTTSEQTLVDDSTTMRYTVPNNSASDNVWNTLGFNDNGWTEATPGLGYETSGNDYGALINSPVSPGTTSAYTRFTFNVTDPSQFSTLSLEMQYDDGFVAYLNGVFIQDENAPATPAWNSTAGPVNRPDQEVLDAYVEYDVSQFANLLVAGENVLAIHALNQNSSSDMLMIPRLVAGGGGLTMPIAEGYFAEPTPGAPNGSSLLGIVADTNFSVDRGFFTAPFTVEITTETPDVTIVYTTDGSTPEVDENLAIVNGALYTGAVPIAGTTNLRAAAFKLGFASTNVDTQTYLFLSDIIAQTHMSTVNSGFPVIWGSTSADYGLDPDVIGPGDLYGGAYAALIEDSLTSIPSVSLTLDSDDFFGPSGIYSNPQSRGISWERATSAEWIFEDESESFQIDAGLRIHGGASRTLTKKHALRLLFKSDYGDSKLNYPLFGEDGVDKFDTIVLRPHFNDGWGWDGAFDDPLFIRDQWFRDTQAAMGHASSRGNLVHLYVNGLYWGLYNPSERPDDSFAAELYGGDKTEYDVVNHNGLHSGSMGAYNTMIGISQMAASGANEAQRTQAYFALQGKLADGSVDPSGEIWLDMVNYIDYMILNHYGGNNDWPNRNWYSNRRTGPESEGFRFVAWDSEIALALSNRTSLFENNLGQDSGAAEAYGNLVSSEEFRLAFADRIHEHLFNSGALYVNPSNQTYDPQNPQDNVPASRFADLADTVYDPIVAESARWGDQHVTTPRTRDIDWQNELDYMLGNYFRDRHDIVMNQWLSAGYYPQTDAPEFLVDQVRQHGGVIGENAELGLQNPNSGGQGTVYYTTDGSDPRLIGGAVNLASASVYTNGIDLATGATEVQARVLFNGEWSALTVATFEVSTPIVDNADFNNDGFVNAADYTVWRDNLGSAGDPGLPGDANFDGSVDSADYQVWRAQYGTTPAVSPVAAVAESQIASPVLALNANDDAARGTQDEQPATVSAVAVAAVPIDSLFTFHATVGAGYVPAETGSQPTDSATASKTVSLQQARSLQQSAAAAQHAEQHAWETLTAGRGSAADHSDHDLLSSEQGLDATDFDAAFASLPNNARTWTRHRG